MIMRYYLTIDEFKEIVAGGEDEEIVRVLATNGLGSLYAEEIMANTEISKKALCSSLSAEEVNVIFNALKSVFEPLEKRQFNPMIVNNKKEVEKLKKEEEYANL